MCTNIFKSVAFSTCLSVFNFYAGFSGLLPIDSIFWLSYSLVITTVQMGFCFVMDQDAPMIHAAKIVNRHPLLDKVIEKNTGKAIPAVDTSINVYE